MNHPENYVHTLHVHALCTYNIAYKIY